MCVPADPRVSACLPQELLDSGFLTEVHKFSKFIHGSATLFPGDVRAVPYWVDDESVSEAVQCSEGGQLQRRFARCLP